MKKKTYLQKLAAIAMASVLAFSAAAPAAVFAAETSGATGTTSSTSAASGQQAPPDGMGQGMGTKEAPSTNGVTTITSDNTESGKTYKSDQSDYNAILATAGTSTLSNITVTKTGDTASSEDNSSWYGVNSGILVKDQANVTIKGGTVTTNAKGGNGIFVYGTGAATVSDVTVETSQDQSGGIMIAGGGGTLTANNVTVITQGQSSAAIRSDNGGGTMVVNGGTFTANGQGSPAIYCTADITVNDATLVTTKSEGVIVEGSNSVTLNNTKLTANNTAKNNSKNTEYATVMLYQSMSGDASSGHDYFTAKGGSITSKNGNVFFVTNQSSTINLENVAITNEDSANIFLKAIGGAWGSEGKNGGHAIVNASNQKISGNIVTDSISEVVLTLKDKSSLEGTVNSANTTAGISVTIESGSTWKLTGDSYVSYLDAAAGTVDLNGHKLYVDGKEVSASDLASAYKGGTAVTISETASSSSGQPSGQPGDGQTPPAKPGEDSGATGATGATGTTGAAGTTGATGPQTGGTSDAASNGSDTVAQSTGTSEADESTAGTKTEQTSQAAAVKSTAKTKVTAKALSGRKAKVSWKKISGAKKYQIVVKQGSKVVKNVKTSGLAKTLSGLSAGKTYKVYVRGIGADGSKSAWSKAGKVKAKK